MVAYAYLDAAAAGEGRDTQIIKKHARSSNRQQGGNLPAVLINNMSIEGAKAREREKNAPPPNLIWIFGLEDCSLLCGRRISLNLQKSGIHTATFVLWSNSVCPT